MVFVWSYLTDEDPAYTLVQVSLNDLIMLVLFAPIVRFLVSGAASLHVPFSVLLDSVLVFIVIPLGAGSALRYWFVRQHGMEWFEKILLPRFAPVTVVALLITLVFHFCLRGRQHYEPVLPCLPHRYPDSSAGLFQFGLRLRPDAGFPSSAFDCRTWGIDGRQQLFRTRSRDRYRPLWAGLKCCARNRRRCVGGGPGHAPHLRCLQLNPGLVPGGGWQTIRREGVDRMCAPSVLTFS